MQASEWKFTYIYNERSRGSPKAMLFPCAGAFASFARQKKRIVIIAIQIATTIKSEKDRELKDFPPSILIIEDTFKIISN